jgi:hypothetical protein
VAAGLVAENKPGDAILFLGRSITHNSVEIQGGARSMLDAFVHQDPLIWKNRQHKALTACGRKGKPGTAKKEKKWKGKGKQRAMEDEGAEDAENVAEAENAENAEGAMEMGDPGTDEELETMYMLRLGKAAGEDSE